MKLLKSFLKKYYNYLLFILVAIITVTIIRKEVKLEEFMNVIYQSNLTFLSISVLLLVVYWLIETYLLVLLIRFEYPTESFHHAFTVMMIGQYYNQVTPSSTGGQPLQLLEMSSQGIKLGVGTAVLVQKYALYQLSVTIVGILGILTNIPEIISWPPLGRLLLYIGFSINFLGAVIILLVTFNPKIAESLLNNILKICLKLHILNDKEKWSNRIDHFVLEYTYAIKGLKKRKVKSILLLIINIIAIFIYYAITFTIFKSLNVDNITIFKVILLQSVCYLMIAFVPLPGAAGGAEIGFVIVFGALLGSTKSSVALLAWRIITFYLILAAGGIYIAIHSLTKSKNRTKLEHKELNEGD